jgi:PAS domain S-box-containing protein
MMADSKSNQENISASKINAGRESSFSEEFNEDKTFLLASIVESSDDAIITKTSNGIITSWNSGAESIYGFSAEEVVGRPISILIPPGQVDEVPGVLERIKRGEGIHHYETVRKRKDGRVIHVSVSISPVKNKQGQIIGASTIARDITTEMASRKQAEDKLSAASQYARSLIESSLDPLVTISGDGKITDVNEATIKVTGIPREQLIGADFSNYFTEPEKAREGYQQVFAKGFVTDYPLTIRHKDGRLTDVLYNASVYKDTRGNVIGIFAAARDVTARKRAEEELAEQRRRELDRLAELEKFQRLTVGRELKMVELKKEIENLKRENDELKRKSQ